MCYVIHENSGELAAYSKPVKNMDYFSNGNRTR